jgi:hypothetical protein
MVIFNILRQAGPGLASRQLRPSVLPVVSQMMANPTTSSTTSSPQLFNLQNHQQVRTRMTKRKRHIIAKKQKWAALALQGIFPPRPPNFLDKDVPVVNAKTREQRDAEAKAADAKASNELKARMQAMEEKAQPTLRFHMEGITMSDRVRKLFDLTNGNQKEAVKAQKRKGMELFQVREGDTGSSAVQGTRLLLMIKAAAVVVLAITTCM